MRLWHYKLIPFLPKSQLMAQWRELNSIFRNQPRHILINYVYAYPKEDILIYSEMVYSEILRRGYRVRIGAGTPFTNYFGIVCPFHEIRPPFPRHHHFHYLRQCYYNLEEKYDRAQKDFDSKVFNDLYNFYDNELRKYEEGVYL